MITTARAAGRNGWPVGATQGPAAWSGFSYDSRRTQAGELFVALSTTTGDGHDHVLAAIAAGATRRAFATERRRPRRGIANHPRSATRRRRC
ncbi:MAG: hypothetical protein ACOX3S_01620 [Anaerolineae bacterium]